MKAAKRRGKRAKLQEQIAGAVMVDFYGYGHNPWTWEQAEAASRREPARTFFLRDYLERKSGMEAQPIATDEQANRLSLQMRMVVEKVFYGWKHNPWTWEQAVEAQRRHPEKERFIRRASERKAETEAKMRDGSVEM